MARRGWNEEGVPTVLLTKSDDSIIALIYNADRTVAVSTFCKESEKVFKQLDVVDDDDILLEAADRILNDPPHDEADEFLVLATCSHLFRGLPSLAV